MIGLPMIKVNGVNRLVTKLKAKLSKESKSVGVQVGYYAHYALYVHERVDIPHVIGQAKYLEQPAREMRDELKQIIISEFKARSNMSSKTVAMRIALQKAGAALLAASQPLVPVDTGLLKSSGYVLVER